MTKPLGLLHCREIESDTSPYPDMLTPCPSCGGELAWGDDLRRLECTVCDFACWDDPDSDD